MALVAGNTIQLLPAGSFRAFDGRPLGKPDWRLDAALAQVLVAAASARTTPYAIDYDHQTLLAKVNGQPAPAAGWFQRLEWREGFGLFAIDVQWTAAAQAMIDAKEYRFISPVIAYAEDGAVTGLLMAAITNTPAILGMDEVMIAAASLQYTQYTTSLTQSLPQETPMDELLEQLRWMLNLPVGSTAEDVLAQLTKLADAIKAGQTTEAAASCDLVALITTQRSQIASLSATVPDPAKYVPIATIAALHGQLAALTNERTTERLDGVVKAALDAGKLLPSMEGWAREYGAKDLAALSSYIANAPPIGLLSGMQSGGKEPTAALNAGGLSANQVALCAAMGISQSDYLKTQQAELA